MKQRNESKEDNNMSKRIKCYTYLRVSTEKQVDGYSIEAQRKNVQKLADLKEFEIVQEYVDAGFSGADIQNRPAFTQMMNDIESEKDGIAHVLSFKLSRLGRNAIDTLESLRKMQEHGVNILTDDGAVDSSSAYGNFFILIMSGLAEMERENILAQTFAGRVEKARQGRYNGGQAPYGYRIRQTANKSEKGILEINEEEAPLIRLIFDRYVNHESGDGKVAEYLVTHGYSKAARENGKLVYVDESFVGNVIRNEVYCGTMVYGKRTNVKNPKTGKISTRVRDRSEWYRSEGLHEPIISKELFEKAQAIRKRNTYYQPKVFDPNHAAIFSGILVCPECGAPMHGVGGMGKVKLDGKHGGGQYYYSCSNHRKKKGEHRCPYSKGWRQDQIDALMANIIVQVANNEQFREDMSSRLGKALDTSEYEAQVDMLSKQIRNKTKTLKRKQMTIDEFDWDVENADTLYDALNNDYVRLHNEVLALEKSLEEVNDTITSIKNQEITKDGVYKFVLEFGKIYKNIPAINKKELANRFIKRIEIFPKEQEDGSVIKSVTFRFPITIGGKKIDKVDADKQTSNNDVESVVLMSKVK
jgi:site-specific DNA recombinase